MRIRILGCSGGISGGARTSAMLIDDALLLDAGTGVGDLSQAELQKIRHVLLTHSHLDHIASLPLLLDGVFDKLQGEQVTVHARSETIQALRDHIFNWVIWPDFTRLPDSGNPLLKFSPLEPGEEREIAGYHVTPVDVEHTVPSQGYIVGSEQSAFAVSGDTATNKTLWPRLNQATNLHTLVVEVSFPNEMAQLAIDSGHYIPTTMAADLRKLQHEPEIWLNAMKPGEEALILKQVQAELPDREVRMLEPGIHLNL